MNIPVARLFTLCIVLLALFNINAEAQSVKTYAPQWKKVDELVKKELPQSALAEVKKIYALAKKEKQDAQVIKSLVYMTELQEEPREDNETFSIAEIEKEIKTAQEPAASILNSLLAINYWMYLDENRWEIRDRTQTTDFKKEDIATWGIDDLQKKIRELFLRSIQNEKLLQQASLQNFDPIILKGNVRHLRPTLYDLLAHRALEYFKNDDENNSKPAYAFEIDQASAFDPVADFIHRPFPTRDSISLHRQALLIYQRLLGFHINDAKPDALIDADLNRIEFVYQESVHPDKDKLYLNALNHIAHQYENLPAASQASYLMAEYYSNKAQNYKPYGDTSNRYGKLKAKEICERIIAQKDSSEGKLNCQNLLASLNSRSLQFLIERVTLPNQPFRALIKYKNFSQVSLRIIKLDEALKNQLESPYEEKYWPSVIAAKPLRTWEQSLPAMTDLQEHAAEIKVDALPVGEYLLVASTGKNLNDKNTIIGARIFYVSSISYIHNDDDFFVLNRESGQPLAGANVEIWQRVYNSSASKYVKEKLAVYQTNSNGHFRIKKMPPGTYAQGYYFNIVHNSEKLFMDDQSAYYNFNAQTSRDLSEKEYLDQSTYTWLFTDRSIYRPGQAVFFKGITTAMGRNYKKFPRSAYQSTVYLHNANYERIDSLKIETNEYGSFSSKFQLPTGSLNGLFSIQMKDGRGTYTSIRVEEYKRPKFSVDYEPLKGTYRVNDKIKLTGFAKAYAGNAIDGATVRYRVVRQPRFPYPWYYSRIWLPPTQKMEIAHGELKTDKDGKFTVEFTAIPDLKIDKKLDPLFDYVVYADVTDINGETRTGIKTVTTGYKALIVTIALDEKIPVDSLESNLRLRTENMNGEYEPATIKMSITRLKEENRLIRQRLWERPDQFVMSKNEYISHFPYDEYDNETDPKSWEKGEKVLEKTDSARVGGKWRMENGKLRAGFYVMEVTTIDKYGEEVKVSKYFELYDRNANKLTHPEYLWASGSEPVEPGQRATINVGSSANDVFMVQKVERSTSSDSLRTGLSFIRMNNETRSFAFPVTEADRGGYGLSYAFVKHNRLHSIHDIVKVPWTNKDLQVEYASFRENTLPGSEEKWTIKITGYKKEKVAAEVLASMYDASLDQFTPHSWTKPSIWLDYYRSLHWDNDQNFLAVISYQRNISSPGFKYIEKNYDEIMLSIETYTTQFVNKRVLYAPSFKSGVGRNYRRGDTEAMETLANSANMDMDQVAPMRGNFFGLTGAVPGMEVTVAPATGGNKPEETQSTDQNVQVRKNFNETVFFFPDLRTDSSGAIQFSFTMPDALTKWKFQALAHTKDLAFGYSTKDIITQKQLMVQPNTPRFLRQGDKMELSAKLVNLTEKEMIGQAELQLLDAATNQPVDAIFKHTNTTQAFKIAAGQSTALQFPIEVPKEFSSALTWRIVARSTGEAAYSDGEENAVPVLSNRMLVTETMPLNIRGTGTKNFSFDKLLKAGSSNTLQHQSLVVEYTSNPAWYAVQSLPYLMEYPYDCAEQTWNRYYANSLATMIANSSPRIKEVFNKWKASSKVSPTGGDLEGALLSNLQKNQELKSVLLEETPWVLQAKTESEQKQRLAMLFDMIKMSEQLDAAYEKLKQSQLSNGGFVWFKGGPDDRYITQYIVTGIGHLKKLKAIAGTQQSKLDEILYTAIPYLDKKIKEDYDWLVKSKADLTKQVPNSIVVQYLYMRSFFPENKIPTASQKAYTYFRTRAQKTWTQQSKYMQGMLALALSRTGDAATPAAILRSLKETSINHEEMGMYWKDARRGWWWYEAPIERQALLIEAFQEISKDTKTVDDLRTWLLKNKQTNNWESTKATAEACYALLLQGTQWLNNEPTVQVQLGNTTVSSTGTEPEAGTGYFKKTIAVENIDPKMGNVAITVGSSKASPTGGGLEGASWGAVYWQYFEDLDKITNAATPLQLVKKLFVETNSDRGPVLTPVNEGDVLKIGDKIKVRIELRVDRDMEYVHMKDMRASAMEPVNVLSNYKWQGGLGYYETTKDASTNFFFSSLRKGTYVFEYPLFVTHAGNFSNGIASIQSMYAPEFSSHSEGIRISVK